MKKVYMEVASEEKLNEVSDMNWYDMPGALEGFENNPAFLEKMAIDDAVDKPIKQVESVQKHANSSRENSWARKHSFKKKYIRRYRSINPQIVDSNDIKYHYVRYLPLNLFRKPFFDSSGRKSTNRHIRHLPIEETNCRFSCYKKMSPIKPWW